MVVEDGTGLVNADSFCSLDFADEYFETRANSLWTGTDDAKEAAIIRASDYIEQRWSHRFKGEKQFPDNPQSLSFPRLYIDADDSVPLGVKRACAEYALRALSGELAPDASYDSNGQSLSRKRTKVGPIETDLTYTQGGTGSTAPTFRPYPAADAWLRPYLLPSGGNRVIR